MQEKKERAKEDEQNDGWIPCEGRKGLENLLLMDRKGATGIVSE